MPALELAFATLNTVVPGGVMTTPVGVVFNVTGMVAVRVGAVAGFTLTVTAVPGPVVELQTSVIVLGLKFSTAACIVPVEIINASSDRDGGPNRTLCLICFVIKNLPYLVSGRRCRE